MKAYMDTYPATPPNPAHLVVHPAPLCATHSQARIIAIIFVIIIDVRVFF